MRTAWMLGAVLLAGCGGDDGNGVDAGPPELGKLFINEVMPSNATGCTDIVGEFDDWIELYNSGGDEISLAGFTITDDFTMPAKVTLTADLEVPAHGYLMLWADDQVQGLDHVAFKLNAGGEAVTLFTADGAMLDTFAWSSSVTDQSYARVPDGTGAFAPCAAPTCGAANRCTP
jgi:lamin tail-like protein